MSSLGVGVQKKVKAAGKAGKRGGRISKRGDGHFVNDSRKIIIREQILKVVGKDAAVFDVFGGKGLMFHAVWNKAKSYCACDTNWCRDERLMYVADNCRVLRSIDLQQFSIFDFDAFGSPWDQILILSARRSVKLNERIGIAITEGSGLLHRLGGIPKALSSLAGLQGRLSGISRWQEDVIDRAITGLAKRMGCAIERQWRAKSERTVLYYGLVLRGTNDVVSPVEDLDSLSVDKVEGLI